MSLDFVTELILQYRYWILIPLTFIEGPIVAFVAGTLASVGFFSLTALAVLFFVRDVGLDAIYYAIGHFGGDTPFAHRMLKKIGVTENHMGQVRNLWIHRPATTMFLGKLSYGISAAFIIAAGMMKMPLKIFFLYGSLIAILQYGTLLFLGYFLGTSFGGSVEKVLRDVQYVVALSVVAMIVYFYFAWRIRKRFLEEENLLNDTQD